jgi:outer membrane lipoprotein-sorting protein
MKATLFLPILLLLAGGVFGQSPTPAHSSADLNTVLARMDETSKGFRSGQADFEMRAYAAAKDTAAKNIAAKDISTEAISAKDIGAPDVTAKDVSAQDIALKDNKAKQPAVKDTLAKEAAFRDIDAKPTEVSSGKIFCVRKGGSDEIEIQVSKPEPMQVLIKGADVMVKPPEVKPVAERSQVDPATLKSLKNMAYPFALRSQDLRRDYEVKLIGWETVDAVNTAQLELVPRNHSAQHELFTKAILWIDPQRDVVLRQKLFDVSGDYQLAHYTNIKLVSEPTDLKDVLAEMDEGAKRFKAGKADFTSESYLEVTKDKDESSGQIFSRKKNGSQEVALQISKPHPKQVLIKDGKATVYDPRIKETTERSIGDKADAESVANIASPFGVNGQDLLRDYEVKLLGWEPVDGVKTAKLELVPRKEGGKKLFSRIILWIDLQRDVALQQQRFQPDSGDYQLAHYRHIQLSDRISDDFFKIRKGGD